MSILRAANSNKRNSASLSAPSASASTAAGVIVDVDEIVFNPDPKKKSTWANVPNPNSTIADLAKKSPAYKCDVVRLFVIPFFDPMGQPKSVVSEINGPHGLTSKDPETKQMAINVIDPIYLPISLIIQGKNKPILPQPLLLLLFKGPAVMCKEVLTYCRAQEVFGRRNETRLNFIPPNSVRIYENFTAEGGPNSVNFDVEHGSWIDYRQQYSTASQDVSNSIQFFRELDGKEVTFEYRERDGQQRRPPYANGFHTPVISSPNGHHQSVEEEAVKAVVKKRVQVIEQRIVLNAEQVEIYLQFSEVLNRLRTDYKANVKNNNAPATPGGATGGGIH